ESLRWSLPQLVPLRCVRMRQLGLLASRARQEKLARCRHLLAVVAAAVASAPPTPNGETPAAGTATAVLARCPACGGGPLRVIAVLAPQRKIPHDQPRPLPVSLHSSVTTQAYPLGAARSPLLSTCSPTLS